MKRFISLMLIVAVFVSAFAVGNITTSAASSTESVSVTNTTVEKNGYVTVNWRALSYCKFYRVFYKIDNTGWVKAADVSYTSQGNYYPGQIMKKRISVPLYRISSGSENNIVRIYVTVRGMDRNKNYNTSFRSYLVQFDKLVSFTPRLYLQNMESGRATFTIFDPSLISSSTKFRVFYRKGNNWKAIGDFNKNNFGNKCAIATLYVPLYKYNYKARFTVRGINNSGQYTTPFLSDAVVENYPNYQTYNFYRIVAGYFN